MKTVILIVALVIAAQATNLQNEMSASLADLSDHPFGKSMVSLLSMNMKTGGPLHELRTLLQQIKDELIALTQVQDQEWTSSQRRCQVDVAQLTATLEQAQADLQNQRQEQTSLQGEQTTLNQRVRDDTASLERNGKAQNDAVDRLNSENSDFASKNGDYSDAVQACKEAQRLLMNLRSDGASLLQISQETQLNLVQTKENFKKIKEMLEQHSKKTSLTLFQPIIEGLVEMTNKVNPETLNNVLNLIARLITALQEGQDQLQQNHSTQVENLTRLQEDLRNERGTLQSAVATGSNRLKEIQSRLNELDGLLTISNAIVEVTQANLADANVACGRKQDEYSNQKVSRTSEVDIVDRLLQFVNERLAAANGE